MSLNIIVTCTSGLVVLLVVYIIQINHLLASAPTTVAGPPLTEEQIRAARDRLEKRQIDYESHLPTAKKRRYIVVGGSGIIGGQIILDLLSTGVPPSAIRIIDLSTPIRASEFASSPASEVELLQADVTKPETLTSAFSQPWHASVSSLPLTVFHTVALIRPFERRDALYYRCRDVNVDGTANVLQAASDADAELFIYTSSCTAEHLPVNFFPRPSFSPLTLGKNYSQVLTAKDFALPLRPTHLFATNYARSKAEAERVVVAHQAASHGRMRTGIIRPGNAVYGHPEDKVLGRMLALRSFPAFGRNWAQSWISVRNASLAHLQFEEALLGPYAAKLEGKAFLVTDDGPPLRFSDVYRILDVASTTGLRVSYPPPVLLLFAAHIIEWWSLAAARFPLLKMVIGEPQDPVLLFQPAVFSAAVSAAIDDSEARKLPEEGGIGYRPACTSLEGMTAQAAAHIDHERVRKIRKQSLQ